MEANSIKKPSIEWLNVFSPKTLNGFTLTCTTPLTFLIDGEGIPAQPTAWALRTAAGQLRPTTGKVRVFERDPYQDATLRTKIALLGDDWLFTKQTLDWSVLVTLGKLRGLDSYSTQNAAQKSISQLASSLSIPFQNLADVLKDTTLRLALSDTLANIEQADLILWLYPERYGESAWYRNIFERIQHALERNVPIIIATTAFESMLMFAQNFQSQAALVLNGQVTTVGETHSIPWMIPLDGISTRMIQVVLDTHKDTNTSDTLTTTPSARFASQLLLDPQLAHTIVRIEMISPSELWLHVHDPRLVAKALAYHAHAGVPIAQLSVHGAPTSLLAPIY